MYTGFAEVYDTLMNDVHYGAWADMYARMMTAYGIPRNAKVCECACGTGSLTLPLQQLGYEMMGIDLSQEMLWQAAQKARKAGSASRSSGRTCGNCGCIARWTRCWRRATG